MGDPLNLDAFLGLEARTRLGLALEQPQGRAADDAGEVKNRSWREAWQRAMEQAQMAGWTGWFTGPPRPAVDPSGFHLPAAAVVAGGRLASTEQAGEQAFTGRASLQEGAGPSVSGTSRLRTAGATPAAFHAPISLGSDEAGPDAMARSEVVRPGTLKPAPALPGEVADPEGHPDALTDELLIERTSFDLGGTDASFRFSDALTQGLTGSLSSGAVPGLEPQVVSGLAPALSDPSVLAGAMATLPAGNMAETQALSPPEGPLTFEPLIERPGEGSETQVKAQVLNRGAHADVPVRLTAEVSEQGVRVWLGIDFVREAELAPELIQLTLHIQQWLATRGERLISLICNGREVWRDTLERTTNALHQEVPRPVLSASPLLISRKPV